MFNRIRRIAILLPAVAAIAMTGTQAQAAGVATAVVTGNVNLFPGFTFPPVPVQNQNFTGSLNLTGVSATSQCLGVLNATANFNASSIAENVAGGVGTGTFNASGNCTISGPFVVTCVFVYARVGPVLIIVKQCVYLDQIAASPVVANALLIPNQTPPATITSGSYVGIGTLLTV
ncbi:MAG TPA: hypothetical protein VFC09_00050 [Candidatus Dormibacteraeota bacterium]|nr:hypothetical protein [Candidatus Dormibacteraeota bacterium]